MHLSHLALHNFRNYVRLDLDLLPGVTVLLGNNAQGKTNLLEAIFYLATSRSPQAGSDREVINWLAQEQEPLPYSRLVGRVVRGEGSPGDCQEQTIEITLTQEANNGGRYRKQIRLNGVPRRAMDLLGRLNVVLFLPEDIGLVHGPPSLRRRYLDITLCQVDPAYCRALARYTQVLTQRNALLRDLRERGDPLRREDGGQLAFWDERLVEQGSLLVARRRNTLVSLDELARHVHHDLTDGAERLRLNYLPSVEHQGHDDAPAVAQAFAGQLAALRPREIAAGVTLAGPHRDEIRFLLDDMDAGVYGSRGQQRTVSLALKLAEADFMRRETGESPLLLLDDILSELDAQRRGFLAHRLEDGPRQALITSTDRESFPAGFLKRCDLRHVQAGRVHPLAA